MKFPPPKIAPKERVLGLDEINALPCTEMARKFVERLAEPARLGWTVDVNSELVSHDEEFGYIYRYRSIYYFTENEERSSEDQIQVLWSQDCRTMGIASFPTFDLNIPSAPPAK